MTQATLIRRQRSMVRPRGTTYHGPRLNDWIVGKTVGAGGDYVNGDAGVPGGEYYWDPLDMSPGAGYLRAADINKPYHNCIRLYELDGPGTVSINLKPESAAAYLGQTPTQAYNDTAHGGGFRANGNGRLGLIFDGGFGWNDGTISLGPGSFPGPEGIIFHRNKFVKTVAEWRRQFDIIRALRGVADPGPFIPNDSPPSAGVDGSGPEPNGGPYWQTYQNDLRFKGGNQPTCIRGNGTKHIYVIGCDVGPCGDDAFFGGVDLFAVIGSVIHEVGTSNGAVLGNASSWFHPDIFQSAGGITKGLICDTTYHGHLNLGAEFGHIQNLVVDRVWQGMCGIIGGIAYKLGGWNMNGSTFGTGAPAGRVSGHFIKGFSNGLDHRDGGGQVGHQVGDNGWHCVVQDYGDSGATFNNISVAVPAGVTVAGDGLVADNAIAAQLANFLASTAVPHYLFKQAYGADELLAVVADYNIDLDFPDP